MSTTLIVESGQITTNANTYVSEVDAISYINSFTPYADEFVGYVAEQFKLALIQAALAMDTIYGNKYKSTIVSTAQTLLYPRSSFRDNFDRTVPTGTIPTALKHAQTELAILIYRGVDPYAPVDTNSNVLSKSVAISGAISTSTTFARTVKDEMYTGMRRVERVLEPILNKNSRITSLHL